MPSKDDVLEIDKGEKPRKKRFTKGDHKNVVEYVLDQWQTRERNTLHRRKVWDEIDRQLRMEPIKRVTQDASGKTDENKAWMPEVEIPLQAQALEVLTADAREQIFPDAGEWFIPHADLTDENIDRLESQPMISGDIAETPSRITQADADHLVQGFLATNHAKYDLRQHINIINAETFKYGVGIARVLPLKKSVFQHEAMHVEREDEEIPVLVPRSIKNTYLDDNPYSVMHEGHVLGESVIYEETQRFEDIKLRASKGSTDPDKMNGGWMPKNLPLIEADKDGNVTLVEWEGDLVVPRKTTESLFIPGVIVTVATGSEGSSGLIRARFRKTRHNTYLKFPYHQEHVDSAYATSPLMKGYPIQVAAVEALTRLMMVAALNAQPPTQWDRSDPYLAAMGGPKLFPGASLGTRDEINPLKIGDPAALQQIYVALLVQYADTLGINSARLGRQTVSHTTAFAKGAELQQGAARTVDYVKSTLQGPLRQFLNMEYELGRKIAGNKRQLVYIPAERSYVKMKPKDLPDNVMFEVFGTGGPAEKREREAQQMQSLNMAMNIDALKVQAGLGQPLDYERIQREILNAGGWSNADDFFNTGNAGVAQGAANAPAVEAVAGGGASAVPAALQALSQTAA